MGRRTEINPMTTSRFEQIAALSDAQLPQIRRPDADSGACPLSFDSLKLAWERLKRDYAQRHFVSPPRLIDLIEMDADGWLQHVLDDLISGFKPDAAQIVHVPKSMLSTRHVGVLPVRDSMIYTALVGQMLEPIWRVVHHAELIQDLAYTLAPNSSNAEWIEDSYANGTAWRESSIAHLRQDVEFVVTADVANFYDNIDHTMLLRFLREAGVNETLVSWLGVGLKRWSAPRSRGIPMGMSASDILAKLYLSRVDGALVAAGFRHIRFVDDFRIYCSSKEEAHRALSLLSDLLHGIDLGLQPSKTAILTKQEAHRAFSGFGVPVPKSLLGSNQNPYSTAPVPSPTTDTTVETLRWAEATFSERFLKGSFEFNRTLFRFLLGHLGDGRSAIAASYAQVVLEMRPEETDAVLRYFSAVGRERFDLDSLIAFISSSACVHDYQRFQVVRWVYETGIKPNGLLATCRGWAARSNAPTCLRTFCVAYVGRHGRQADLQSITISATRHLTREACAEFVYAVSRLHGVTREQLVGQLVGAGYLIDRAIRATNG